jgi:hypothetical protein
MLNISQSIYTGWNSSQSTNLPEAVVIPQGDSSSEKKKLEKLTKSYDTVISHTNIPLPGFTLFKSNQKRWGTSEQTWLIIDPRGFLARITNDNLEAILHVTGITEGLIQEKCVWARENSGITMTLVPQSSELYIEAINNTDLIDSKVDIKTVQIGDTVLLQNKVVGTYMGVLSLYGPLAPDYRENKMSPMVYLRRQVIRVNAGQYHYQSNCKILKVLSKTDTPLTREDSAALINTDIKDNTTFFTAGTNMTGKYYSSHNRVKHVSPHAVSSPIISCEPITLDEALELFMAGSNIDDHNLLLSNGKICGMVDYPYNMQQSSHSVTLFEINAVIGRDDTTMTMEKYQTFGVARLKYNFSDFTEFFKIVKHVKTESYI